MLQGFFNYFTFTRGDLYENMDVFCITSRRWLISMLPKIRYLKSSRGDAWKIHGSYWSEEFELPAQFFVNQQIYVSLTFLMPNSDQLTFIYFWSWYEMWESHLLQSHCGMYALALSGFGVQWILLWRNLDQKSYQKGRIEEWTPSSSITVHTDITYVLLLVLCSKRHISIMWRFEFDNDSLY